ncbi:DUF4856 domain-containing protein [Vicingus serpentipes]|uniref:DUF4856 domain-containing protein n=2 Tax=Vicingus serpentipes TaxID=1926625 RepID=A0A5C6RUL0_9FLAO|nr:DUF4856 domain-containing protein [Vicingus serpentipes]
MMVNLKLVKALFIISIVIFSIGCSKDDESPIPVVEIPNPIEPSYSVPSTYNFVNASGASTVDFNGQKQRLEMAMELIDYIKTANTLGVSISASTLNNMYANTGYTWLDVPALGLTGSTKQLKDKTAEGDVGVQNMVENYFDSLEVLSNLNYDNSAGTYGFGGVWDNGVKSYLQAGSGIEYKEMVEKVLICAVFMNQMTINYLGSIANDDNDNILSGKTYTEMQHHWDEAYGYFTSEINYPTEGTDRFWGKYTFAREAVLGSATTISQAFRTGRAAIDNKDYLTRDVQIAIIRNEMEKICAGTAINYLNQAKSNLTNSVLKNHQLSEAKGLIDGLRYGYNSVSGNGMTSTEIDTALVYLNDFENITVSDINTLIDLVASKTGLTSVKTSL